LAKPALWSLLPHHYIELGIALVAVGRAVLYKACLIKCRHHYNFSLYIPEDKANKVIITGVLYEEGPFKVDIHKCMVTCNFVWGYLWLFKQRPILKTTAFPTYIPTAIAGSEFNVW